MELQTGKVATGRGFVGREALLQKVTLYMEMNQSVVLIAPRRFGKTSLIKKLIETNSEYKAIEIDLMKIYNVKNLAEKIVRECYSLIGIYNFSEYLKKFTIESMKTLSSALESVSLSLDDIEISVSLKLFEENDPYALLEHALSLPEKIAQKLGIKVLFAIDELGEVVNLREHQRVLEMMRATFQYSQQVNYIFAGSQYSLMNAIFTDKNSPFFRFAEPVIVPPMREDEFLQFFKEVFKGAEVSLYRQFTKDVVSISGGIPYYITKVVQIVLIDCKINQKLNTYRWSVCKAALIQYQREEVYFNQELSRLRGKKHYFQTLKVLSREGDPYKEMKREGVQRQNVRKILKALEDDGLIEQQGTVYRVIDPFLNRYIRKEL
ncbi:MAG TPA: ATP-binding protein [Epsilonproteobacteria bacterium]|nr:ATP-binding protein [Campylobacterota bacterium]